MLLRKRNWPRPGGRRLAPLAAATLLGLLVAVGGLSPLGEVTVTMASGVPYLERLELISNQATGGPNGDGNGWGSHTLRVERTSTDDIFALYVASGADTNSKQWVLTHRSPAGGWNEAARGVGGLQPAHVLVGPNNLLSVVGWPSQSAQLVTAAGPNGATPFSSQTIPGPWKPIPSPYAATATNARGDVFVLASDESLKPSALYIAYRTAADGQWHSITLPTDLRYSYVQLLPDNNGGLTMVASDDVKWSTLGWNQPSGALAYVWDHINYWHSDNLLTQSFQQLQVASYPQPSGTNAFVSAFPQDSYLDTQGRTHILYSVQTPSTGQQVVGHHAIIQNGSVVKDVALNNVYCPGSARMTQDTAGRFYLITGCSANIFIYPADTNDGTQLGPLARLDVSAYPLDSWFWLAVPRGGTPRADYVDGVYSANNDTELVYFRARLNYSANANTSYPAAVMSDQPVGYWRLGETSGTLAMDASGNGNTGTYAGGVTLGVGGALGGDSDTAVKLDNSSGHVTVPAGPSLEVSAPVSVEAWVKPNSYGGNHEQHIVTKGSGYGDWNLGLDPSGRPFISLTTDGNRYVYAFGGGGALPLGTWSHLVGTFDGYKLRLHANGVAGAPTTWYQWPRLTNWTYTIGQDLTSGNQFDGSVDEVAVYSGALAGDRVSAHYGAASGSSSSSSRSTQSNYLSTVKSDGPAGYWRLDESSGSRATDSSGNGKDGTYSSAGVTRGVSGALVGDSDAAAGFDGASGRVTVNGLGNFTNRTSFSAEAWVNPSAFPSSRWGRILSVEGTSSNQPGWALYVNPGSGVLSGVRSDASGSDWVGCCTGLPLNQWSHVVLTYDGNTMFLYLNGQVVASTSSTRSLPSVNTALQIASGDGTGHHFSGSIDEPAVYALTLNADQVRTHYDAGRGTH